MTHLGENALKSHLNNICKCTLKKNVSSLNVIIQHIKSYFWSFWFRPVTRLVAIQSSILSVTNNSWSIFHVMTEAVWFYSDPYNLYYRVKHGACDLLRQDLKVAPQSSRCAVAYFLLCLICCAGVLKVMANHSGIKRSWQLDWNTLALIACVSSWPNQPSLYDFNTKHATSHALGVPIMKRHMIL